MGTKIASGRTKIFSTSRASSVENVSRSAHLDYPLSLLLSCASRAFGLACRQLFNTLTYQIPSLKKSRPSALTTFDAPYRTFASPNFSIILACATTRVFHLRPLRHSGVICSG
jgi:hypothetical protein